MFDQRGREGGGGDAASAQAPVPGKHTLTESLPSSSGGGAPLPDALGGALGSALGADVGGVRVHTGAESAASADSVGARAYTVGQDIHFGAGQYDPGSSGGQELIAHETAHTVQQRGASAPAAQAKLEVSQPGDAHEVEADAFASSFVAGGTAAVTPVSEGVVARAAIQRDPTPGAPNPAAAITWTVPTSVVPDLYGTPAALHTKHDVAMFLIIAKNRVLDLPGRFHMTDRTRVDSIAGSIDTQLAKYRGDEPLTQSDVGDMTIFTGLLAASWHSVVDDVAANLRTRVGALNDHLPSTESIEGIEGDLAEEMHNEFLGGHESRLDHLSHALHQVNEYKERVQLVAPWVRGAITLVSSAHTIEQLEHFAERGEQLSRGLAIARGVVEAARSLDHVLSHDGASGAQSDINNFETAINAIDIGMTFAEAVPLIGQLWAFYYGPLTRRCIELLRVIARADDREGRDLSLLEFMQTPRPDGATPRIPRELESYFPGGQPVLNVMYPLLNGGEAAMNPAAEQFFISRRGLFNAGAEGHIETQSNWHVFHPSTWGAADSAPNILEFLRNNADRSWAMLYGNMPHTLR